MRTALHLLAVVGAVALTATSPVGVNAQGDSNEGLRRLRCIQVGVSTPDAAPTLGPSPDELRQALLVAVRSKLPRLVVSETCTDRLRLWFYLKDISSAGRLDAFYGHMELKLFRPALLLDSRASITPAVWASTVAYFHGPKSGARERSFRFLDELVTQFAAEYYEAENP